MRLSSLLLIGVSALTLSACSTLGLDRFSGKKGDEAGAETVAAAKALPVKASAQEEKEMAALMGESSETVAIPAPEPEVGEPAAAEPDTSSKYLSETDTETAAVAEKPADHAFTPGVPDGCPAVEVLPDTKSITYFDDKDNRPIGDIVARASLTDVRGGCEYSDDGVVVDIDMLMQGHISDKGRYEGRRDLEAFMTFPYFVAVMDPDGKMIDKKIMATAMRFKPEIDDLDHAEKITQTIPLKDIGLGSKYTITLGFQLNRQQLDYNRGSVSEKRAPVLNATPAPSPKKTPEVKAETKAEVKDVPPADDLPVTKTTVKDVPSKSTSAPAQGKSSGSKMTPIVD